MSDRSRRSGDSSSRKRKREEEEDRGGDRERKRLRRDRDGGGERVHSRDDGRRPERRTAAAATDSPAPKAGGAAAALGLDLAGLQAQLRADKAKLHEMEALRQKQSSVEARLARAGIAAAGRGGAGGDAQLEAARQRMKAKMARRQVPDMHDEAAFAAQGQLRQLKINRRMERAPLLAQVAEKAERKPAVGATFDPRLAAPNSERKKRSLNFVEPGTYVRRAQQMRAERWREKGQAAAGGEQSALEQRVFLVLNKEAVRGGMEWWDVPFGRRGPTDEEGRETVPRAYCDGEELAALVQAKVTHYVEHPVQLRPVGEAEDTEAKSYLTKKEQKRIRRIRRAEEQKEKRLRVMAGLDKPEEARATLGNMIRVYGAEAFQDPTKVDQLVRQQMQKRLDKHLQQNAERKLTKEERKKKKLEKLRANTTGSLPVVVYRIRDMSVPLHRKKIDHTAKDCSISGVLLLCPEHDNNVLVAEGGPRALKKFKRLMDNRIRWHETPKAMRAVAKHEEEDEDYDEEEPTFADATDEDGNKICEKVWEGAVLQHQFKRFRFMDFEQDAQARAYLLRRNIVHYWDQAVAADAALAE
mmetsp:Transcript_1504/g.5311  ORF Transcript_1504/g.5311 Transcript_1504/m.5311 type:complete len:583 (+) Transcript_1504:69-1817(+)